MQFKSLTLTFMVLKFKFLLIRNQNIEILNKTILNANPKNYLNNKYQS